jgi:multiple sugar transport system ATP-binding protein
MARVQLLNVTKLYPGGVRAVDGVSLDIADREFVVLVGPSGCGKSTSLRMIAGLEDITGGEIRIGDRVVNRVPPKDRDIAMVFQNYALYPHMTVYRNMAFGLILRRMPGLWGRLTRPSEARRIRSEIDAKVRHVAKMLELDDLLDRKPKALSGGQRQRVAVGRAIVREPAAFLFDEPLSNLDAKLRVTTRAELKRLHQRLRTTTVYVTHDQEEAMTLGDRIVVMKDGKIQQADAPLKTYNEPANRFVAGFIGMPPMNFFDGTLSSDGGRLRFVERLPDQKAGGGELTPGGGGFTLWVPPHLVGRLGRWVGRPLVIGIRPEHLHLRPVDGNDGSAELTMTVNVVEPLGNDMDIYMDTGLHNHVVARVEANSDLRAGSVVRLYVDSKRVHFFEPGDTGMNLSLSNEPAHAIA